MYIMYIWGFFHDSAPCFARASACSSEAQANYALHSVSQAWQHVRKYISPNRARDTARPGRSIFSLSSPMYIMYILYKMYLLYIYIYIYCNVNNSPAPWARACLIPCRTVLVPWSVVILQSSQNSGLIGVRFPKVCGLSSTGFSRRPSLLSWDPRGAG